MFLRNLTIATAFILALGSVADAQITPTNISDILYDSASTFNGEPLVFGSVVKAFDPDGVLCGMYVVDKALGHYGFMPVYGDDIVSLNVDEGAETGDLLTFEINGRPATVVEGDPLWNGGPMPTPRVVRLSANATIGLTIVEPALDKLGSFNRVVRFEIGVRNDGEGTDFYGVSAVNSRPGFSTLPQADTMYAESGETVYVTFDIKTPIWPGADTVDVIDYTVFSLNDPTVSASGQVRLYFTITDVNDGDGDGLPWGFALYQNYPNPFNPSTTISYSLPSSSRVQLQVLDILGRTVDGYDLGEQSAGEHEVLFDGAGLASGVYFYRIITDTGSNARKMILMK